MKKEYFLKIEGKAPIAISKAYFTVGLGSGYDLAVESRSQGILFSIACEEERYTLYPANERSISINSNPIHKPSPLRPCDRIEWAGIVFLFLDGPLIHRETVANPIEILNEVNAVLDPDARDSVSNTLKILMEKAGAEAGALVCETKEGSEWNILAQHGYPQDQRRKQFLSHTILEEAIQSKKPVYIESIIGHPWEQQALILESQLFSAACIPLSVGDGHIFGALFFVNRTPGLSIRQISLGSLKEVATQVALLHSTRRELKRATSKVNDPMKEKRLNIKRITANLPASLLKEATQVTGKSITETLVQGLELLRSSKAYEKAQVLKGKLNLDIDLESSRERHRR